MARLCGSDSYYRAAAGETFEDIFRTCIDDVNNQISTPAVIGLIRIDQADAFEFFKHKGFTSHPSARIRGELISIAAQIGTPDDLAWLASITANAASDEERKAASEAMMNIFQKCKGDVVFTWAQEFSRQAKEKNDEFLLARARTLFETAEKKAQAEEDNNLLFSVRSLMAQYYADTGLYELAAKYYGLLLQSSSDSNQTSLITARLLDVDLRSGHIESVKQLVTNFLLSADLAADAEIRKVLEDYFTANQHSSKVGQTFATLASIKISVDTPRPLWFKQLEDWESLIKNDPNTSLEPNISTQPSSPKSAEPNAAAVPAL
jgi:hypothetical protein